MKYFLALILLMAGCSTQAVNKPVSNSATPAKTPTVAAKVTIDSPDGLKLVGSLYEVDKPGSPALLLLHQWQSDRHSYDAFAKRMQTKGFVVLSIDGRGFGDSTKKADGSSVSAGREDADVKAMLGDVGAAIDFLKKQNNVDANRIGIVGASYGSSLAIIYAVDHPDIRAVALLSPGLNYFGNMPTHPAVEKYRDRPLFMAAASDDAESAKAVAELRSDGPTHETVILSGTYHGTYLFDYREKPGAPAVIEDGLETFFTTHLAAQADHK